MRLSELPLGIEACVEGVLAQHEGDAIARRLRDLGFVRGEPVRIVATGPLGAEPLLALIGHTRFALRHGEAARVRVRVGADTGTDVKAPVHEPVAEDVAP